MRWIAVSRVCFAPLFVGLIACWAFAGARAGAAPPGVSTPPSTLLDEVGRLWHPVADADVSGWRKDLRGKPAESAKLDRERIWLGEYLLARDEQPEQAQDLFDSVRSSASSSPAAKGLAAYDSAMADFYRGDYRDAADDFHSLLTDKSGLTNFPRRNCALWYRHALGCANYHSDNARKGIPEPPALDPLCGAASLAASLRSLSLPFEERSVVAAVKPTGEGSTFAQVVDAGSRLGVHIRPVKADDKGLQALPKPIVAFVELDHFVSVTKADAAGVDYLCSDCGAWPGGAVHLTWAQWHDMNPGIYAVVTVPGSRWDRILDTALAKSGPKTAASAGVAVAALKMPSGLGPLLDEIRIVNLIKAHVVAQWSTVSNNCGNKPNSLHCQPSVECPMDCNPASPGDPVNLATGEEEYSPPADITVYNPIGPSVSWRRLYNSLRGYTDTDGIGSNGVAGSGNTQSIAYESDDYGLGWSTNYNMEIIDPSDGALSTDEESYWRYIVMPNGARVGFQISSSNEIGTSGSNTIYQTNPPDEPMLVTWTSPTEGPGTYTVTLQDHSAMYFAPTTSGSYNYQLTVIYDKFGNHIKFNYGAAGPSGWPLLSSINNSVGTALLTISRAANQSVNCVTDNNGRSVYYYTDVLGSVPIHGNVLGLLQVSQIVTNGTLTDSPFPPSYPAAGLLCQYGYTPVKNDDGSETVPGLSTIGIQEPSNPGVFATTTIYYATSGGAGGGFDGSGMVSSIVDPYGNQRTYSPSATENSATVNIVGTSGTEQLYDVAGGTGNNYGSRTYTYDTNESTTSTTDLAGNLTSDASFAVSGDPLRPAVVQDGNSIAADGAPGVSVVIPAGQCTIVSTPPYVVPPGSYPPSTCFWVIAQWSNGSLVTVGSNYLSQYEDSGWSVSEITNGDPTYENVMPPAGLADAGPYLLSVGCYNSGNGTYSGGECYFEVEPSNGQMLGLTQMNWEPSGQPTSIVSPRGTTTSLAYNADSSLGIGLVNSISQETFAGVDRNPTTIAYTASPASYPVLALPNDEDVLSSITSPKPGTLSPSSATVTTSIWYDWENNSSFPTDQEDSAQVPLGNIVGISGPGNNATSTETLSFNYEYDGSTFVQYEAVGEPITVTDDELHVDHYRYDSFGNVISYCDQNDGATTDYYYNIANQLQAIVYPSTTGATVGAVDYFAYTYPGGPVAAEYLYSEGTVTPPVLGTDDWGTPSASPFREVDYAYGPVGELQSVTAVNTTGSGPARPELAAYTYDGLLRIASVTNGKGNVTSYQYDPQGYLCTVAYPGATGWSGSDTVRYTSFDYDGNPLTRIDGNGVTTTYAYDDPESLLTGVSYPSDQSSLDASFTYDGFGRRVSMAGGELGSKTYTYDDDDDVTDAATSFVHGPSTSLSYAYYPDGSLSSIGSPVFSSGYNDTSFNYTYDARGELTGLTDPFGYSYDWDYDGNGWLGQHDAFSPSATLLTTNYTYNARGELTDLRNHNSSTTFSEFGGPGSPAPMTYDAAGNRLTMPETMAGTSYGGLAGYTYDYENQLLSVSDTRNGGAGAETYVDDADGNPTTYNSSSGFIYNSDDWVTTAPSDFGTFAYDGNGNPTTYSGAPIAYDAENRPVTQGSSPYAMWGYDPDGFLAADGFDTSGSVGTFYLGTEDGPPLMEMTPTGTQQYLDVWGPSGLSARYIAHSSAEFYAFDPEGNAAEIVNTAGGVNESFCFNAYGQRNASTAPSGFYDAYAGAGGQWGYRNEPSLGIEQLGHRFYNPNTGRFVTRDPIGVAGGVDPYEYAGDNPTDRIDPSGLMSLQQLGNAYINNSFSGWFDNTFTNGSVGNLGTEAGEFDSGCASGMQVAEAAAGAAINVGILVIPGGEEAKGGELLAKGGEELAAPIIHMAAPDAWRIVDGVRRSKAADLLGQDTITAVQDLGEGREGELFEVPLGDLYSSLEEIDLGTNAGMDRWMNVYNGMAAGEELPPIVVQPAWGIGETPIGGVGFGTGEE